MYIYICICIYICVYMYMCDVYTASVLPLLLQSKFSKVGSEKNDSLGILKDFFHAEYLPGWLAMFLIKKKDFQR